MKNQNQIFLKTPLGIAKINGNENGVSSIQILDEEVPTSKEIPDFLQSAAQQLDAYFKGNLQVFDLTLNPEGTAFQQKVWKALSEIPYGKTCSYLELSRKLGDEKAIRAVASANGKNPLWVVIPCHRVIGSDGSLTGYAGGLQRKQWLLNHENNTSQLSMF
ncbi:methylated-DNA--[protein]-cysteine S-methyltransferase [Salegentibacter sp. JZCK2]|uniref:methylated-DNA--[protein]-cysteine S-methyltransferase n=1 Tax=Salegentibacter tibetensis TaxID=2873600 RepID=UPI001CC949A6|nr:methylated-DNA--[protein]-cysteine S-methyltransferase [Salegentibacter tibetensis]MBZ9730434.1 methylated-DNA--[protein]-cysteine S-methyltransferase [Salegentibacter tibetensis]